MQFNEWIEQAYALGASDLHLESDTPVVIRIRGELQTIGGTVARDTLTQLAQRLLGAEGWAQYQARGSADISEAINGIRCRFNFFQTVRGLAAAVRLLAPGIKDLRACNLHKDFRKFLEASSGLIIISGPTGSGKSTTLAALIEEINATRARHIVTLESPLEYIFANRQSFIRQREVPTHSPSFEQGITDALRENPDVLVISEMRTPEVMRLTLNAAETGHLVLTTMHSATCAEALSRVCMSFPSDIQPSVRAQLADCLVAVCCQRLDFLSAQRMLVPRFEILLPTSGAKGTIRAGTLSQLANVLQSGGDEGMWTFERYQRWMAQVVDWVRPPAAAARERRASLNSSAPSSRVVEPPPRPPPAPRPRPVGTVKATPTPADHASSATARGEDVIEVPAEEMDLAALAELAKKVVERKPP
jgi:twitching motility protein PilT